jgi:hypothetical protein
MAVKISAEKTIASFPSAIAQPTTSINSEWEKGAESRLTIGRLGNKLQSAYKPYQKDSKGDSFSLFCRKYVDVPWSTLLRNMNLAKVADDNKLPDNTLLILDEAGMSLSFLAEGDTVARYAERIKALDMHDPEAVDALVEQFKKDTREKALTVSQLRLERAACEREFASAKTLEARNTAAEDAAEVDGKLKKLYIGKVGSLASALYGIIHDDPADAEKATKRYMSALREQEVRVMGKTFDEAAKTAKSILKNITVSEKK